MEPTLSTQPAYSYEPLTPDNCALLLIDHQAGLFLRVRSMDQQTLKNNALALAKTARVFDIPTVLFTSSAQGPKGPTVPELKALFPDQPIHDRSAINLWEDAACRNAVTHLKRPKLVMAAITTDVCLVFPALAARAAGYEVYCRGGRLRYLERRGRAGVLGPARRVVMYTSSGSAAKCTSVRRRN